MNRRRISLEYLDKVQFYKNLETYQKFKLIDGLKQVTYTDKEFIFHEGDKGELFYIIEVGQVECGIHDRNENFNITRILNEGDHFGEISLINNVKRTLSVRAKGEV